MIETHLLGHLEALLFAAGEPLPLEKIGAALELNTSETEELVEALKTSYAGEARGLRIRKIAGGIQLTTKPELFTTIQKLVAQQEIKLSNAAMETLAIIAFKQPVTRSEMEAIRGVKVDGVVNTLLDLNLITEAGRKDVIGRPILYGTTDLFLVTFGLDSLHDLPEIPEEILSAKTQEVQEGALFSGEGEILSATGTSPEDAKVESPTTEQASTEETTTKNTQTENIPTEESKPKEVQPASSEDKPTKSENTNKE